MEFTLCEGDSVTRVMSIIGRGTHGKMGELMNMRRHVPTPAGKNRLFQQLYSGTRLVSSTY